MIYRQPAPPRRGRPQLTRATVNFAPSIVKADRSQWEVLQSIGSIANLPMNWDGYGSRPPGPSVITWATELILRTRMDTNPVPQAGPESDGGIQIDWKSGRARELELHAEANGRVTFLKIEHGNAVEEGEFAIADSDTADELLNWLNQG